MLMLPIFRWKKCKGVLSQLTSGDSAARPGQRGTTGQLIFSKCDDPPASCECQIEPPKPSRSRDTGANIALGTLGS